MKIRNNKNGFTLIELIIVMVILGIMAAVAVPRYLDSIANAEQSAEDAVISAIRAGLKQQANNALLNSGRAKWPQNPFDALHEKPIGFNTETNDDPAYEDGMWTFVITDPKRGYITHQRGDNSRWQWEYFKGKANYNDGSGGDEDSTGYLGEREPLTFGDDS